MRRRGRPSRSPAGPCSVGSGEPLRSCDEPLRAAAASRALRMSSRRNHPSRGARRATCRRSGMGFTGPSGSVLPVLADPEMSLAPSPPPALPPKGGACREMGGLPRRRRGTIGFPTALRTFAPSLARDGSSSRTAARAARVCVSTRLRDPPDLRCRLARHLPSPSVQPVTRLNFLSWFSKDRPSVVLATPESTPGRHPCGASFGWCLPEHHRVPSSWFSTTSTAFASDAGRVCCNALPTLGFIPFRTACRRLPSCRASFPGMLALPFEAFPPLAAPLASPACRHAVHREPCLLALLLPSPPPPAAVACSGLAEVGSGRASRPSSTNGSVA